MSERRQMPGEGRPDPTNQPDRTEEDVLDWARREGLSVRVAGDLDLLLRRRRRFLQRASVLFGLLLVTGVFWTTMRRPDRPEPAGALVLRPEKRVLPDGSVVELQAGARIEVDFSDSSRRLALVAGTGHFQVVHDPSRPFVVAVDGIEVRAIGTAFAIERGVDRVEVLVTEGRVAVDRVPARDLRDRTISAEETLPPASFEGGAASVALLAAGEWAVVARPNALSLPQLRPEIARLEPAEISRRLSWRVPRLEFSATPLSRVVELFNDHAQLRDGERLELGEPELGDVLLSGTLRADDVESLLHLLEVEFRIRFDRNEGKLTLRRR